MLYKLSLQKSSNKFLKYILTNEELNNVAGKSIPIINYSHKKKLAIPQSARSTHLE